LELRIICDNEAGMGLQASWGFSCLIDGDILFDTGNEYGILGRNMDLMGIDPADVRTVVISHDHWDHAGGLAVLEEMGESTVIVPRHASTRLIREISSHGNVQIVKVGENHRIKEGIRVLGNLGGDIDEIVVLVDGGMGAVIITGCAHPGLDRIIERASLESRVKGVVGGFHGFDRLGALKDMDLIVPCHCTRYKERLLDIYPDVGKRCRAGITINV